MLWRGGERLKHGAAADKPDETGQDELANELHDLPVPVHTAVWRIQLPIESIDLPVLSVVVTKSAMSTYVLTSQQFGPG